MDTRKLSICFGTNNAFRSKLIQRVTDSELTHSWLEFESEAWGGTWVAHSTKRGVITEYKPNVLEDYPKYETYLCLSPIELSRGMQSVVNDIGIADYDYGVIWNGVLLVVYKLTKWERLWNFTTKNASKISCSELIAKILLHCDFDDIHIDDPEFTTTGMLREQVAVSKHFERTYPG
jgi:hypothetical protein